MGIIASGLTDIGMKRKSNQDSIFLDKKKHLYVVCDGMGGHSGGDIASQMAVEVFPQTFYQNSEKDLPTRLKQSVKITNDKLVERSMQDEKLKGMGTTIVSLYFNQSEIYITNVGDSRAYLVNNQQLFQLTRDHSLVQEKINLGIYNREQAKKDLQKNVLVRTVGYDSNIETDVFIYKVSKNDLFLICSDGLHSKATDHDIITVINKFIPDVSKATQKQLDDAVKELIDLANSNGGNDNISVILVAAI